MRMTKRPTRPACPCGVQEANYSTEAGMRCSRCSRGLKPRTAATRHPKNKTRFRTLDMVAADPRVLKCYQDSDGVWVDLAPGYNWDGCSGIREDTVRDVLHQFSTVEAGDPY